MNRPNIVKILERAEEDGSERWQDTCELTKYIYWLEAEMGFASIDTVFEEDDCA